MFQKLWMEPPPSFCFFDPGSSKSYGLSPLLGTRKLSGLADIWLTSLLHPSSSRTLACPNTGLPLGKSFNYLEISSLKISNSCTCFLKWVLWLQFCVVRCFSVLFCSCLLFASILKNGDQVSGDNPVPINLVYWAQLFSIADRIVLIATYFCFPRNIYWHPQWSMLLLTMELE